MVATLHRIDRFLSVELSLTRLPPMAVVRSSSAVTAQNAAGKKEITTVLLLLVKFCRKYEFQRHMKKRWPLKNKGSALFGCKLYSRSGGYVAASLAE